MPTLSTQGRHPLDPYPDPSDQISHRAAVRDRVRYHREMARLHPPEESPINWDDFKIFVKGMAILLGAPIIIPMRLIHNAITSPLTISIVLKLMLLGILLLASSVFSVLAVGAFFWSWKIGGNIEVEGWLFYGSKNHRAPHTTVYFPLERIEQDLRYDVQVELELVRPAKGTTDEMGNFMLSLEMRALDHPERVLITAAQPSLPPASLPSSFLSLPVLPTSYLPCIIPYPFRSLCPSRLLGYSVPTAKIRERRAKGGFSSRERGKDVVPLKKDLMEGVVIKPGKTHGMTIGSGFVSIGREDLFDDKVESGEKCKSPSREVKTTGWVLIRLIPRPTGVRWILSAHPIPPLLLLPPIAISLTFSSSILAFTIITLIRNGKGKSQPEEKDKSPITDVKPKSQIEGSTSGVVAEGTGSNRRTEEWNELESTLGDGLPSKDGTSKASSVGSTSTIGGSGTSLPSISTSFGPTPMTRTISSASTGTSTPASSSTSPSTSDSTETITPTRLRDQGQSVIIGSSSGGGTGGSSSSHTLGSGGGGSLRRRGSNRRSNLATGTSIALSQSGSGVQEGSDTERENYNNDGNQAENEDEDGGEETEIEHGNGGQRDADSDWREFGREFGLNT